MKRRLLLKGLGGAALAAPFLSSVQSGARAQTLDTHPRRLVIFYTCNGCLTNRWFPKVEDGPLDVAALEGTTLDGLGHFVGKLLFPRGLEMFPHGQVEVDGDVYFDPHDQAMGSKLTGAPIDPVDRHYALGRSLDHLVAERVNPNENGPLVLSVGSASNDVKAVLSYSAAREPFLPQTNPKNVYASLTGVVPGSEADHRIARGQSIIDAVRDDLDTFRRLEMSTSDQRKIDAWLELLRETEQGLVPAACNAESMLSLGITDTALAEASVTGSTGTAFTLGGQMMMKLIALAMLCDKNRSIILQWPAWATFRWDGIEHNNDHAGLSHRTGSAAVGGPCLDGVLDMLREIDRWYAGRYVELVSLLDSIHEGERTLLDNSAVVWLPELADGSVHNVNNLPIVIAGSAGGYLKQGVSVNLAGEVLGTGDSEKYCTEPGETIGFDTGSSTGHVPLNKLYVTLLNAVGATNDGAPFESFGQVDSNDLEAGITAPGELAALKA